MRYLLPLLLLCCGWTFNWTTPVDMMGKPRGAFATTPFPITESSTSYSITNDESPNGKTFTLGTLYFVDGGAADDTGTGLTFASPKQLLASALALVGSNVNATVLIRGAHDSFNGIYTTTHYLGSNAGQDDTHRVMLVGYGQERPFFTGSAEPDNIILRCYGQSTAPTNLYVTLQRLGFTNCTETPVGFGYDGGANKRAAYVNCIDLSGYDLGPTRTGGPLNGLIYYLDSDYGLISHCTVDRIQGHAFKVGDGASHDIVEWCYARDVGVRDGQLGYYNRSVAYDFPSDRTLIDTNKTLRYSFATNIVAYGVEVRRCQNIYIHHNEIAGFGRGWGMTNMPGAEAFVAGNGIYISPGYGAITNNKVFDTATTNRSASVITSDADGVGAMDIWNNLIYSRSVDGTVYVDTGNTIPVRVLNNTIIASNATYGLTLRALGAGGTNWLANNIVWQQGTGDAGQLLFHSVAPGHSNNLYYYPDGSAPEWGTTGDVVGYPLLAADYSLSSGSPAIGGGVDLSALFTTDFNSVTRTNWDIGAMQYVGAPEPPAPTPGYVQQLNVGTLRIGP